MNWQPFMNSCITSITNPFIAQPGNIRTSNWNVIDSTAAIRDRLTHHKKANSKEDGFLVSKETVVLLYSL